MWSTPFPPQWKLGVPSQLCLGWGLWRKCVSTFPTHFDVEIFSLAQCVGVTLLVSGFLSEGIAPGVAVHSVHPWKEGNPEASCVTILVQRHKNIDKLFFLFSIYEIFRLRDRYYFHLTESDNESQRGLRNPFKIKQPEHIRSKIWTCIYIAKGYSFFFCITYIFFWILCILHIKLPWGSLQIRANFWTN